MGIENVASEEHERLVSVGEDFDNQWLEAPDVYFETISRQEEHLASEAADLQFVERYQPQLLHYSCRYDRAIRTGVYLSRHLGRFFPGFAASERHVHERRRRNDLLVVAVADHVGLPG